MNPNDYDTLSNLFETAQGLAKVNGVSYIKVTAVPKIGYVYSIWDTFGESYKKTIHKKEARGPIKRRSGKSPAIKKN